MMLCEHACVSVFACACVYVRLRERVCVCLDPELPTSKPQYSNKRVSHLEGLGSFLKENI